MEGVENKISDKTAVSLNQSLPIFAASISGKMNDTDDPVEDEQKELSTLLEDMCLQVEKIVDEFSSGKERSRTEDDAVRREDQGLQQPNEQNVPLTRRSARNKSKGNAAENQNVDNQIKKITPRKPSKTSIKRKNIKGTTGEIKFDVGELSYPTSPISGKKKRPVMEDLAALDPVDDDDEEDQPERACTFCNHTRHISSLYYCGICRRVYHSRCVVNRFMEYVDENIEIERQISNLIHAAEGFDAKILRCNSCKDAFIRFYKSKGYQWKCTCEMCENPIQLMKYRRRILQHLLKQSSSRRIEVQVAPVGLPRFQPPPVPKNIKKKLKEIPEVREIEPAEPARKNLRRRSNAASANSIIVNKESVSPVHVSRKSTRTSALPETGSPPPPRTKRPRRGYQNVDEFSGDALAKIPMAVDNETHTSMQEQGSIQTRNSRLSRFQARASRKQGNNVQDSVLTDDVSAQLITELGMKAGLKGFQKGRPVTCFNVPMRFLEANGYTFKVFSNDCGDPADEDPLKKGVARYSPEKVLSIQCECCGKEMDYEEFTAHSSSFRGNVQVFIKHNHGGVLEWFDLIEHFKDYPLPNLDDCDTSDHLTKSSVLEKLKIQRYSDQSARRKSKDGTLYQFNIVCKYTTRHSNQRYREAIYVFSTERPSLRSVYCPCTYCNGKPVSSDEFARHTIGNNCKDMILRNYVFVEDQQTFLYEIVQELEKKRKHGELESFLESKVN